METEDTVTRTHLLSQDASCSACGSTITEKPKNTFWGFKQLTCPNCQEITLKPLHWGYRIFYFLLVIPTIIQCLYIISSGNIPIIGIIPILAGYALFKDDRLRAKLKHHQAHQEEPV